MATSTPSLTSADRALLGILAGSGAPISARFWERFRAGWGARLRDAWEAQAPDERAGAFELLRREHRAEARPDLARVHSSWFVRALLEESPAVRRAVAASAPEPLGEALRAGLGLSAEELAPDRPPHPDALRWVGVLWVERLVGDRLERPDDPPVIRALTLLPARDVYRLVRASGLAKWAISGAPAPRLRGRSRARLAHFARLFEGTNASLRQRAARDVAALDPSGSLRLARLGMTTIARLLEDAEPYRVRWALQHHPYPVARYTRTLMSARPPRDPGLVLAEARILGAAWERLVEEGLLPADGGTSA